MAAIHELITEICRKEQMPEGWEKASIIPILKSGHETDRNNYRGISLLDVVYKIFATIIKTKLEVMVEETRQVLERAADQLFLIKEVYMTCYECNIPAFVDFKKG